jgi:RNA polymerase sigma-70 factor (ECF subfamily)
MDEAALIAAAQDGDREAFNDLVVHYQSLAYNVAYRVVGDPDVAADATQNAFISAYRGLPRFRGGSFRSWLLRIVTNACYDELRAKKRRRSVPLDPDPDLEGEEWTEADTERPDEHVERQDLGAAIQRALEQLPAEQRAVVVLCDIQGMSYEEMADTLEISLGTVKSRLSRGRRKMRDYLQENAELLPPRYRLYDKGGGAARAMGMWMFHIAERVAARWLRLKAHRYD